ncbi:hypothetical protein ACWGBU_39440, partial [Streptomyces vinaceus]
ASTSCGPGRQNDRTHDHAEQPQTAAGNSATESAPPAKFAVILDNADQIRNRRWRPASAR